MQQEAFLSPMEMNLYSVGGSTTLPNATQPQIINNTGFDNLISNLEKKGEVEAIELLQKITGANNPDPQQILEKLYIESKDPAEQQKLLETVENIVNAAEPALNEVTNETTQIVGDAADKIGKKGISVGWDIVGTLPVVGELSEGLKTFLDVTRAAETAADAAANVVKTDANAVKSVESNLKNPNPIVQQEAGGKKAQRNMGKKINNLKKIQSNSLNRIANAVKEFQGTRKRKNRGTKSKMPLLKMNSTRHKKTRKT
jgi:hypothetical protein